MMVLAQRGGKCSLYPAVPQAGLVSPRYSSWTVIWIALGLSPSQNDWEGMLGENPEQNICLIIPNLFTEGEKPTSQMPLHC